MEMENVEKWFVLRPHTHTHTHNKIAQKASQLFWNLITEPRRLPIINYSSVINEVCGLAEDCELGLRPEGNNCNN